MSGKTIIILIVVIAIVVGIAVFSGGEKTADNGESINKTSTSTMDVKSSAFEHEGNIPSKYTCDGENMNPSLQISDVPENTKSLALVVDDPDATGGGTFDHWVIWNISPQVSEIKEGEVPEGATEGKNNFGNANYGGPCPPQGDEPHRYMFKLYALDKELELEEGAAKQELEDAINDHVLGQTALIGYYGR